MANTKTKTNKLKPTTELIENIIQRIPEGFIDKNKLSKHFKLSNLNIVLQSGRVSQQDHFLYDRTRLSPQQVREFRKWCRPMLPEMLQDGTPRESPIIERLNMRQQQIEDSGLPIFQQIFEMLGHSPGYVATHELNEDAGRKEAVQQLVEAGVLRQMGSFTFDPLRLGVNTMQEVCRREALRPRWQQLRDLLLDKPGGTMPESELQELVGGKDVLREVLALGGFSTFKVEMKTPPYQMNWVKLGEADADRARRIALEAVKIKDEQWQPALELCGDVLRPGARDGSTRRIQVVARTYTINSAAKRLGIRQITLETAVAEGLMPTLIDPEGRLRLPAAYVERAYEELEYGEQIAAFEQIAPSEIALVTGVHPTTTRRRLKRANIDAEYIIWGQVRGRWGLPNNLREFYAILKVKSEEARAARVAAYEEQQRILREQLEEERRQREELRARLVAAFPTWRHEDRAEQQIILHVGPPNSGKTHDALNALVAAGNGWYLAPLRLLAFEIFDRLTQRGIPCNLLTGEEYIPVEGAQITAATIEMFNPQQECDCVVIDEAQMLADPDRGWAWTRAMMEARVPEIHMIGPPQALELITQLAKAATLPVEVIEHQRLTPIEVADRSWPLAQLPNNTILVAFSRRIVLHLKTELERMRRTVSVVYGNLPPEVRRRQAERFASGQTEICVATDAVGMGLNLPAHHVCFYELQKFDGKAIRALSSAEVQQIGGRAGRFGFSEIGTISTVNKQDLRLLKQLFHAPTPPLTRARIAPSVEDLDMIPGSLRDRLVQWASLQSIPDSLRSLLQTADMDERIELASMLKDEEVQQLGLEAAVKLVNAPTRQSSRAYWHSCTRAILRAIPMPLPPRAPEKIRDGRDLETAETCISSADIYLWLSRRPEFSTFAPDEMEVRQMRADWSMQIDEALVQKLDTARRCEQCNAPLPLRYRYNVCHNCYARRRYFDADVAF